MFTESLDGVILLMCLILSWVVLYSDVLSRLVAQERSARLHRLGVKQAVPFRFV